MKALWKTAEEDFVASFDHYGKGAFVCRLPDTAAAKAVGGQKAFIQAQPSDFIVVVEGQTFFAEVKSSQDEVSFHFSNIQKGQLAASRRATMAGGVYLFFIKSEFHNQWFCLPAALVNTTLRSKKSLKWTELEAYKHVL